MPPRDGRAGNASPPTELESAGEVGLSRSLRVQFVLFCLVGLGNAAVDAGIFTVLVAGLGWRSGIEPLVASVIGFLGGAVHSYVWNSRVTFRFGHAADSPLVVGQFLSVAAGGAVISALAFSLVRAVWPDPATTLAASKLGAIGIGTVWNFSLMRGWVFSNRRLVLASDAELMRRGSSDSA